MANSEEEKLLKEDHHDPGEGSSSTKKRKGGFVTIPFILANEAFERVASFGLTPNMIVYLMNNYQMSATKAQNFINLWNTANSFTPFVGALLADSFLGRFLTIGFGSIFSLLGMFVFWMTTIIPQVKPPPCNPIAQTCESPTAGNYAFLILAFVLMSIGTGGISPCSQVFGADQLEKGDDPNKKNSLEIFLNWYYAFASLAVIVALTVVVYIQEHFGWTIGFGVPVILMFLATISFFLASPFYVIVKGNIRALAGLVQVIVAAFKNRKMVIPPDTKLQYYQGKDSAPSVLSDKLRFLNKACVIQDPYKDIGPDGLARNPWRLCRVEDVEGIKSFIRVIPIWSAGIMMNINNNKGSFSILLVRTMNRHIGPKFEIPAASFGTFLVIVVVIWIPLYDRVLIPLASKICGRPVTLTVKQRMGIGLFCSFMSLLISGIVESVRRQRAISEGFEDDPLAVIHMSALWTVLESIFGGIAEVFFIIGQTEFFYTVLPKNMLCIACSIFGLGGSIGSLIATVILNLTDNITRSGGKDGWIASNVNKGHYDYYYYLLAALNLLNLVYYTYCSRAYGPVESVKKVNDNDDVNCALATPVNTESHERRE